MAYYKNMIIKTVSIVEGIHKQQIKGTVQNPDILIYRYRSGM